MTTSTMVPVSAVWRMSMSPERSDWRRTFDVGDRLDLDLVEVGELVARLVLLPVVRVLLEDEGVVVLERERPGAHRVAGVVGAELLGGGGRGDEPDGAGELVGPEGVGRVELKNTTSSSPAAVDRGDQRDRRSARAVGGRVLEPRRTAPTTASASNGVPSLELDVVADRDGPGLQVLAARPLGGQRRDELAVGVVVDQGS